MEIWACRSDTFIVFDKAKSKVYTPKEKTKKEYEKLKILQKYDKKITLEYLGPPNEAPRERNSSHCRTLPSAKGEG